MHWFDSLQAERQGLRAGLRDARSEAEYWRREAIKAREALRIVRAQELSGNALLSCLDERYSRLLLCYWLDDVERLMAARGDKFSAAKSNEETT